jgi:dienelactone hydrolase
MKRLVIALLALSACSTSPAEAPQTQAAGPFVPPVGLSRGVTVKEANWYSEQVRVSGRLFLPAGPSDGAARPAVVLAPGWGETAESLDVYASTLAANGIVALSIDYRGWGRSGAHLYLGERVDTYDKMRFSEQTPELVFRRGRLDPEHQVQDIRNAITFIQSEPGVDRARIGVLGVDVAGGHVISVMGMDARARLGVAITPIISGQGEEKKSYLPDAARQAELIKLARDGAPPRTASEARARNALEARLAIEDYKPFWRLEAIPQTSAIRFIVAEADDEIDNVVHARAAAAVLKGPHDVVSIPGAVHELTRAQAAEAAFHAVAWMQLQKFQR